MIPINCGPGDCYDQEMLEDVTSEAEVFFEILPQDWQDTIVPYWGDYGHNAIIYVLRIDGEICAGGIVFLVLPPEMGDFWEEAQYWFQKGYHYIGFVWVPEHRRNLNYGSIWLSELKKLDPSQKYWLTTEEKPLKRFYDTNGFRYIKTLVHGDIEEDLFIYGAEGQSDQER